MSRNSSTEWSTASKATSDNSALRYRFERKFKPAVSRAEVELIIRQHPAMFFEEHPERWINNIYWDRPDLKSVEDNLAGIRDRQKMRIRWYGEFGGRVEAPALERKIRRGDVGRKKSRRLEAFELSASLKEDELRRRLGSDGKSLLPTLANRYSRKYFRSADRRFRLTIDTDLRYRRTVGLRPLLGDWVVDRSGVVVELKYAIEYDPDASRIASYLPFRVSRSSKYVTGMEITSPRFRP